jgi:Na+/melibiose symporter-like transporter
MILKKKEILLNMIGMAIIWLSGSFCYYLISYQLKYIDGDLYLNSIVSSISEIIAYIISGLLYKQLGLKTSLRLSLITAFIGMICLLLF